MAEDFFRTAIAEEGLPCGLPRALSGRPATAAIIVFALCSSLASCAGRKADLAVGAGEPDKVLFERGATELDGRKWLTAREYFRQIVDGYPQSSFRGDAKLGLADTYFGENTTQAYVLAINEYREFLTFYPTHPRADYAQYKLAMCHFEQMAKPERDQSETKEALKEFGAFFERFPNSGLMIEARARQRDARDRLSQSEYRVGLFYYRARWYPGAVDRLKSLLKEDPEYTYRDAVYFYLAESLVKTNRTAEAVPYYQRILDEFASSEFLEEARRRLQEFKPAEGSPAPVRLPGHPN
jgi:outer membrane protein assembly factor BamD